MSKWDYRNSSKWFIWKPQNIVTNIMLLQMRIYNIPLKVSKILENLWVIWSSPTWIEKNKWSTIFFITEWSCQLSHSLFVCYILVLMYEFRLFSSCSLKLIDGASHLRSKYWLIHNFIFHFFSIFCLILLFIGIFVQQ